jgi:hypothetical protein
LQVKPQLDPLQVATLFAGGAHALQAAPQELTLLLSAQAAPQG